MRVLTLGGSVFFNRFLFDEVPITTVGSGFESARTFRANLDALIGRVLEDGEHRS